MAENQTSAPDRRAGRCVRLALGTAALAVVLVLTLCAFMVKVDGQARAVQSDLDRDRLRQYGAVK